MRTSRLVGAVLLIAAAVLGGGVGPASAGGGWLYPVQDRAEPGDIVTFVAYVDRGTQGWVEDGPFEAYLRPATDQPVAPDTGIPLGPLAIEDAGGGRTLRVSVGVWLPATLEPGHYEIAYCDAETCTIGLGDLIASLPLAVGVEPVRPIDRAWPLTEPEIANLAPDAVVTGPGYRFTAEQIRSGAAVPPSPASQAAVATTVPAPVTTVSPAPAPAIAPVPAPAPPATAGGRSANPGLLAFGVAIAGVCTVSVLVAMRRSAPPGRPLPAGT